MNNQNFSSLNIRRKRNKISILSPLKFKGSYPKRLLNLKVINNNKLRQYNLYNSPDNFQTLSIPEYDSLQNNSLNKYFSEDKKKKIKTENVDEKDMSKNNNNKIGNKNNKILINIKKFLNRNHSSSTIQINSPKKSFESPSQSLKIINCNNDIFNNISKDSLIRQQILYNNSVKLFEKYANKFRIKMPKIKTSKVNSKITDDIHLIEGKKKLEEVLPPIPSNGDLRLYSYFIYPKKNFPEGREQFSICIKDTNILLSGGTSSNMKEMNFWILDIKTLEWDKIHSENRTNNRFGHTTICDENKIYIYGGRIKEKNTSILVGLEIFSFKDNTFSKPYIQNEPPDRRDHIALIIYNHMLIHGGVGANNEILSDCHCLNLQTLKWVQPHIEQYTQKPKVFGHTYSLVIPYKVLTHKNFSIYKYPEIDSNSSIKKIKYKGLYIFGGKAREDGGLTNDLWILLMGQKPLTWIKPNLFGKPPSPRCFHSMDFFEKGHYLIIHGGRNDNLSETSALDDTFILNLDNLGWIKVELYSNNNDFKVISRYGHKSAIFSNKLIIFGGMNNSNYIGSSLFIVNLDFYYSTNNKSNEQINMEKNKKNEKIDQEKKIKKTQLELGKFKLDDIVSINLPPIK